MGDRAASQECGTQMHDAVADRRPREVSLVQPLRHQHHATAIPCQKHPLSARLLRNTKTSPQYGFARNASLTSADSVCTDLRKVDSLCRQHHLEVGP